MADWFTLTFSFGVTADGEPAEMKSSVTLHQPPSEAALRTAIAHAAHEGFNRLWAQLKPRPVDERQEQT
jgi:hypothetical protein